MATANFEDVEEVVDEYVKKYGAEHVLLAVDIDNTLLAMDHDLGSDQWFEWQHFLLRNEPDSPLLVADSFEGLLEAQGLLYTLGKMHPPQPEQPKIVARLQGMGIATVVLTSRGDEFREPTERELERNDYDFARSALETPGLPHGTYLPYDKQDLSGSGLTEDEAKRFDLSDPRSISYENGVMMVAGQHKGSMLLTLLKHANREIKAVVFVDDHGRHVGGMFAALTARGIEVTTIHYYREDDRVDAFRYSDKRDITRRWRHLKHALEEVFQ